jgi:Flp pilus assembly protein TadG
MIQTMADLRRSRRRWGQALVEFALILPILLTLIFAIIDWGYYLFVTISVNHATRTSIRKAAMNNSTRDQIKDLAVNSAVGVVLSRDQVDITTVLKDATMPGGPPTVSITTNLTHTFFAPMLMGRNTMPVKSSFKSIITTYQGRTDITF